MALLVVRYAEELGYIQNFTVEEYGHRSSTLYYKIYGSSRLIGGHYKIVTYLSLEEYNKKYETLRGGIPNFTMACKKESQVPLCANY